MRVRLGRILLALLVIWLVVVVYFLIPLWSNIGSEDLVASLKAKADRIEAENNRLKTLVKRLQAKETDQKEENGNDDIESAVEHLVDGPKKEYEMARRQVSRDTNELWWFVQSRLTHAAAKFGGESNTDLARWLNTTVSLGKQRRDALLADMETLKQADGFDTWRQDEAAELSRLVQKRLDALQNPDDCSSARKLVCNLNKGCGYGCQIHHAVYCFLVAYGTERTLFLRSKGWRYNRNGFEEVFLPLSRTCRPEDLGKGRRDNWPGSADATVVDVPIVDTINPRPKFLPPSIPQDLADRIMRLHGDPIVWWVSEFLRYLLRPQPSTAKMLADAERDLGLVKPIVGVHVRRTDKVGTEAAFHAVEEYMTHVAEYYDRLDLRAGAAVKPRRVYMATDDARVLAECRKKYPGYEFSGNQRAAKSAAVSSRYTSSSLKGIITDIHMLSRTDYLVCTFSSQVCRIAYELMQQGSADASDNFRSLDDIWYFGGQDEHRQVAVMAHEPSNREEIDLRVGDVVGVAGNHWNGFNKGRNHRTNRIGLYPQYKAREKPQIVDFPTYAHVKL